MLKDVELDRVRYHWFSYVARGGISKPKKNHIGHLEAGGLEHWTSFLNTAKTYLKKYPKDRHLIENFVPDKLVKMLVGE